jgi:membrane-associated phospholipid phosphatase
MNRILLAACLIFVLRPLGAQIPRDRSDKTLFTRRDLAQAGAIVAVSAATSIFDERIAHWTQSAGVQGGASRHDLADKLTVINESPLTIGAFAAYGIGRLTGSKTLADVGLHTTEALVMTVGISELIRAPLGRFRPRVSPDDPYHFKAGGGFTDFAARSYPSIHAAVAFATASTLVEEVRVRKPGAVKVAAPLLYTAAMVPGLTRMYLDQHWASDVVAGTFLGLMIGHKVAHYSHTHGTSRLDRALLGLAVIPDRNGRMAVSWSAMR